MAAEHAHDSWHGSRAEFVAGLDQAAGSYHSLRAALDEPPSFNSGAAEQVRSPRGGPASAGAVGAEGVRGLHHRDHGGTNGGKGLLGRFARGEVLLG